MGATLILLFLSLATANINFCNGSFKKGCIESEREALLRFKQDLIDDANRLASWTHFDEDCCAWDGVLCDNVTGHVLELHLGNPQPFLDDVAIYVAEHYGISLVKLEAIKMSKLRGKINPSLLQLKHLSYLDLSNNAFGGVSVPKFLGSIQSLKYLNLSGAGFGGLVPHELGNLSSLQFLGLFTNHVEDNLYVANLQWLSGLSMLEHLDLSYVNLTMASNWFHVLNTLPSLEELYLSGCQLPQKIPPPPINLNLSSLAILDLSRNYLGNPFDLSWIFHLKDLVSRDLSRNNLIGHIHHGFENMTSLRHLDLSFNSFNSSMPVWLYNLKSLQFLDLGFNSFSGEISSAIGNMTSLRHLDLSFNFFNSSIPDSLFNLKSLQFLDLSLNNLNGEISSAIGNMTAAISLDFSWNEIAGGIPKSMGNLCNLKLVEFSGLNLNQDVSDIFEIFSACASKQLLILSLNDCQLFGQLTNRVGNFKNSMVLELYNNAISGPIPFSIGQLANLQLFFINNNLLEGVVSEIHFANLTRLKFLYTSRNRLILKLKHDWIPPFQLEELGLRNWDVSSQFPLWLRSQKYLNYLDISNSTISDVIPIWFWNSISSQFYYLNLSHNQIHGQIPNIPMFSNLTYSAIDLSFNNFSGPLPPHISSNISFLDLSNNFLSGSLSPLLCFNNSDDTMNLQVLKLGGNFLSGEIPDCWMNWQRLQLIRLDKNNLTGRIPSSMGSLSSLKSLKLRRNNLFGKIPLSLKNCTRLMFLDLGENELYGNISKWLVQAQSLSELRLLSLRSNKFWGHIPDQLCSFTSLQILDLANNNLVGSLPRCIRNFTAMIKKTDFELSADTSWMCGPSRICFPTTLKDFSLVMVMKGQMQEYSRNLYLVRSIDVSNNKLSGEIPQEVTGLFELQSLNLSRNLFTGTIPDSIGVMRLLESLDFSVNKLSGSIPQSITSLTFLSHLNLSCNNLTGEIPSSTQLQSFDPSSYGSNQLCGLPLSQKCSHADRPTPNVGDYGGESEDGFETFWFYIGLPFGFVVGFWSVVGPFLIKRRRLCCGI